MLLACNDRSENSMKTIKKIILFIHTQKKNVTYKIIRRDIEIDRRVASSWSKNWLTRTIEKVHEIIQSRLRHFPLIEIE